jgi:N-methylhydantoinase A
VVPLFPSHFSALGMLLADERHDFIRTYYSDLAGVDFAALAAIHDEMAAEAIASLRHSQGAEPLVQLDLRYVGQEFTLSVPVTRQQLVDGDRDGIRRAFDALYEHRYAHHSPEEPVEMVNIRLAMVGKRVPLTFPQLAAAGTVMPSHRGKVYFSDVTKPVDCPIYQRAQLFAGAAIEGPALIQEHGTTTVLFARDHCVMAPSGEMIITVGGA